MSIERKCSPSAAESARTVQNCSHLGCGHEGLEVVDARALCEALGDQTCLVALDRAIGVALDLQHPATVNGTHTWWAIDDDPCAVALVR